MTGAQQVRADLCTTAMVHDARRAQLRSPGISALTGRPAPGDPFEAAIRVYWLAQAALEGASTHLPMPPAR